MITRLGPDALEFARVLERAFADAGGVNFAREAEDSSGDAPELVDLLDALDVWSLDVAGSDGDREAAAITCRAAGRFALPYPVAERLAGAAFGERTAAAVSSAGRPILPFGTADLEWSVVDLAGRRARVLSTSTPNGGRYGPFVRSAEIGEWEATGDPAMILTLQSWVLLGMIERAAGLGYAYANDRIQFGKPIATFQGARFRVADMAAAVQGLEELAKYTLWSIGQQTASAITDALAFRVAALETAESVFRSSHQLHGAMGFCDETELSWLSRHSQRIRRLPFGAAQSEQALLRSIETAGFDGLFMIGAADVLLDRQRETPARETSSR